VKHRRAFGLTAAAAALLSFSAAGHAVLITSGTNNPLAFSWSFDTGTYLLTGTGSMSVSGFNSTTLNIDIMLSNTAPNLGQGGDRLTAFAFGIDPNATSVSFSDDDTTGMIDADFASGALPANVLGVEVCGFGGSNCSGGSNGGIWASTSDTFRIILGGTWGDSVNVDPIGIRYQTGNGSFTFPATSTPPPTVPEPSSIALLGLGLLGLGLLRRRQNSLTR
jgi:hypothetical protein